MEVKRILLVLCLCVVFTSTLSKKGKPKPENDEDTYGALLDEDLQNDGDDDEYGVDGPDDGPDDISEPVSEEEHAEFRTQPQVFVAKVGEIVRLPCQVSNHDVINIWQRDDVLLYQGHVAVDTEKYSNIREFPDNALEVRINNEKDYGNYSCILITTNVIKNRPRLIHRVVGPTPPKITDIRTDKNEYKIGETLKLTCKAIGYPKPVISWHKGNERLELHGETIEIPNVTPENGGIYRCLADNGLKEPSHKHVAINIEHAPKISISKYLVTSNKERDAELVCTVDAYPEANVLWKKGEEIMKNDATRKIITKRRQHTVESIFVISNLTDQDFGTYTCVGKNRNGKKEEKVSLVKTPAVRDFIKPEKGNKDVLLTWKVESKSPISAHEIQYRKKGDSDWKIAVPEVTNGQNDMYVIKYTLRDLEAGAYETRARSQNEHGWSEYSDIMPFEGEKHISAQEDTSAPQQQEISQKEAPVGESTHQAGSSIKASTVILSIALIFTFYIRH
ncbi:protein amalgam-like isoform X2 [Diabrotica undecimpunctata]|uniref:protein amalgam-like isoform X2 n=1 Tax=Diabrotica undecimpunctata TaxID=50387 RepID=UPI003B63C13D